MPERNVYADHNATTPLHPEVKKAIEGVLDVFGNPSSLHSYGRYARSLVEEARETVGRFINASPEEIMFVGSGSEGNNTILSILACAGRECSFSVCQGRDLITSTIEHPCILETSKCLIEKGVNVLYIDVDEYGKVDVDQIRDMVSARTGLVSVMMANNEIGTVQDIEAIADVVHEKGALFHTDAVQAVGKIPVNVKDLDVDFLTLSGHKIYGPKGVGAIYVKKGSPFCPLIRGGHQERGRRAGTENTLGIVGLAKAIEMRALEMEQEEKRLLLFKEHLRKSIQTQIPDIRFVGHPTDCLP
ncbi:MAG: cysteine desulfurase family protein, partial [Desulfomonilia bacterium]|nr:cysteine desulfurase family protein [Desulfomonilia bacterium]